MRRFHPRRHPAGFTLIELVVAALISLLVIAGLYVVYAGHSRVFRGQEAVAGAQVTARFALEVLKDDLQRAGFMAASNTKLPEVAQNLCGNPDPGVINQIVAVEHTQNVGPVHLPGINLGAVAANPPTAAPDEVVLVGNYTDTETYWVERIAGNQVVLQDRHLLDPTDPFPQDPGEFARVFAPPAPTPPPLARIIHQGKVHFTQIVGGTHGTETINVVNPPGCIPGLWDGARLNVVNKIRYRVRSPYADGALSGPEQALAADATSPLGLNIRARHELVRETLNWATGAAATVEVVAENVVDFQVWFLFADPGLPPGSRPAVDQRGFPFADGALGGDPCSAATLDAPTVTNGDCMVSNIRGAVVRIAVRTPREDPNFRHPGPLTRRPLDWYEVDQSSPGAARVRTLVSQIDMPNMAYRP